MLNLSMTNADDQQVRTRSAFADIQFLAGNVDAKVRFISMLVVLHAAASAYMCSLTLFTTGLLHVGVCTHECCLDGQVFATHHTAARLQTMQNRLQICMLSLIGSTDSQC